MTWERRISFSRRFCSRIIVDFLLLLYNKQVMYESRSIVHGQWPAPVCRDVGRDGDGFLSRVAYSWVGITYLSIGFFLWAITMYSLVGYKGAGNFSDYADVAMHVMGTRSLSWLLIAFVPIMGMVFDVILKVFSNMYYPTQTQIHLEIEATLKRDRKRGLRQEQQEQQQQRVQHQPPTTTSQQQQPTLPLTSSSPPRNLQLKGRGLPVSSLDVSRISNDQDASRSMEAATRASDDQKDSSYRRSDNIDDNKDVWEQIEV
jgi:hypothetical protein